MAVIVTIEVESSRFSPGSYWIPGAEYYAESVKLLVDESVDMGIMGDDDLLEMADDETCQMVMYAYDEPNT